MLTPSPMGRWYCERCDTRYDGGPGDCPADCPEEPLLDLRNEEVIGFLEEQDRRRFVKRSTWILLGVTVLTSPLPFLLMTVVSSRLAFGSWILFATGAGGTLSWGLKPRPRTPDPASIR